MKRGIFIIVVLMAIFVAGQMAFLAILKAGGGSAGGGGDRALGPEDDYYDPEEFEDGAIYTVWYGTNRKPKNTEDRSQGYSNQRDSQLHYGTVDVFIPESHKFGSVGSNMLMRWITLTDDRLHIENIRTGSADSFFNKIQEVMSYSDQEERHALIYIHGFNVDFDEAAIRAAQIGFDLKIPGVTAFYSWPSRGNVMDYATDEATIEVSEQYIEEFLRNFAKHSNADKVHILAHSMGNRGLLRAVQRIVLKTELEENFKFGQIFLAAPDMDRELFEDLARLYPEVSERTTLYVSAEDNAVRVSSWFHDADRVGYAPPVVTMKGIDTVEVTGLDVSLLGHSYFAEAEAMLYDMHNLIRFGREPEDRQRLIPSYTSDNRKYFRFQE